MISLDFRTLLSRQTCAKQGTFLLPEATVHWISSSLGWEFSALNNSCLKKHHFFSIRRPGVWLETFRLSSRSGSRIRS